MRKETEGEEAATEYGSVLSLIASQTIKLKIKMKKRRTRRRTDSLVVG